MVGKRGEGEEREELRLFLKSPQVWLAVPCHRGQVSRSLTARSPLSRARAPLPHALFPSVIPPAKTTPHFPNSPSKQCDEDDSTELACPLSIQLNTRPALDSETTSASVGCR
jgi:hypothetical protein